MDQERDRIHADLRGLIEGEVRCDPVALRMYSSDASIYEIEPLAIVRPQGLQDVVACTRYAAENGLPIHARGAGSGLAGESLGSGLVMDFSHSMRRLVSIDGDRARVQPGLVLADLNRSLRRTDQCFGPDPATRAVTTMGSVVALDAAGSHWLRYGSARSHVESLQVVLADGEVMELGRQSIDGGDENRRRRDLVGQLADIVQRERPLIEKYRTKAKVNRCGYHLDGVLRDGHLNVADMLVGSEGTLALITEATVRLDPLPRHVGVALLFFDRLESAAQGALEVADSGVSACDLVDRRLLSIAREADVRYDLIVPPDAEAMLLIEQQDDDPAILRDRLMQVANRLQRRKKLAFAGRISVEPDEVALFWRIATHVIPRLYRLKGSSRPLPFVEDVAVPPSELPAFLTDLQHLLKQHRVTASLFAHAGHGQLHIRPFLDLADPDHLARMREITDELYDKVLAIGGTISGEHGVGLSRTAYVRRQFGQLVDVFRQVKAAFDPNGILNPGKIVADAPQPLTRNLRTVSLPILSDAESPGESGVPPSEPIPLQLEWSGEEMLYMARSCNGCGACRTTDEDERMCPLFRFAPREESAPRSKANLMRAVITGKLHKSELTGNALKAVADLCVHCHQCRIECPAAVDIPKLMSECKAQYVASNGMKNSDWMLVRIDRLSAWGNRFPRFVNWAFGNRQMRWLMERLLGIAQGRKLPRLANRTLLAWAQKNRLSKPARQSGTKVLYFVDVFANWYDVELGKALIQVLEHNKVKVFVPQRQMPSGMPAVAAGAVDYARRMARKNVGMLADAVRQGYHIVTSEPAAALCLQHEYRHLLDDADVDLVAENTSEACAYLWQLHQGGRLELDFQPVNARIAYHQPCHSRAINSGMPAVNLLRLIPGLGVDVLNKGCSGMAGTYGLHRRNYRTSLRAGWGVISAIRNSDVQAGTTECSACKMQMEQGTTKPTIHPIKMMALAYGLRPEFASLLTLDGSELTIT